MHFAFCILHFDGRVDRIIVQLHKLGHAVDRVLVEAQAGQNLPGHRPADLGVAVEAAASCLVHGEAGGLSHVVQQGRPAQDRFRRYSLHGGRAVFQHVVAVVFAALIQPGHRRELRQGNGQNSPVFDQNSPRGGAAEQLAQLNGDPLPAHQRKGIAQGMGRGSSRGLNRKVQLRRKAQSTENPKRVLFKALHRVAHAADDPCTQIRLPAEGVLQARRRIERHRVDRKIPPGQVFCQRGREGHGVGVAVVCVARFGAEGRDLQRQTVQQDGDSAVLEARFDDPRPGKDRLHLLRQGGGRDVPIAGNTTKQAVTDAAADHVSREARRLQTNDCLAGRRRRGQLRRNGSQPSAVLCLPLEGKAWDGGCGDGGDGFFALLRMTAGESLCVLRAPNGRPYEL